MTWVTAVDTISVSLYQYAASGFWSRPAGVPSPAPGGVWATPRGAASGSRAAEGRSAGPRSALDAPAERRGIRRLAATTAGPRPGAGSRPRRRRRGRSLPCGCPGAAGQRDVSAVDGVRWGRSLVAVLSHSTRSHSTRAVRTTLTCMASMDEKRSVADVLIRPGPSRSGDGRRSPQREDRPQCPTPIRCSPPSPPTALWLTPGKNPLHGPDSLRTPFEWPNLHENGPTSERTDTGAALLGGGCELRVEGRGVAWPGVVRSVLGAGLYLAVLGLLAVGLGTLIRSTVGATAVVVGLVFVLPGIVGALPSAWENAVTPTCRPPPARRSSAAPSSRPKACTCCRPGWALPSCAPTRPPPSSPLR